jgi:anthranilate synthase component 1
MFFRTVVVFDRVQQTVVVNSLVFPEEAVGYPSRLRRLHEEAVARGDAVAALLAGSPTVTLAPALAAPLAEAPGSNFTRAGFEAAVRDIKSRIFAGDCYQVVLSQCFRRATAADPISVYRALRRLNPSPYMFLLRSGSEALIGSSPEMLVRCRGLELEYRPIAGTCARGSSEEEDATLAARLADDEKERAEHVMLVDLGRNDLGRVCEFGSIRVQQLMQVERYSHVQHLVSQIRGRMLPELDAFDALAACFPAGTVTGAPKVKAMEIIHQLEPSPRGPYAGSVFYRDYAGNLDACIAIRMVHVRDGQASVQAGAGIVAGSDPAREYEETVSKAQGMWAALAAAEAAA